MLILSEIKLSVKSRDCLRVLKSKKKTVSHLEEIDFKTKTIRLKVKDLGGWECNISIFILISTRPLVWLY